MVKMAVALKGGDLMHNVYGRAIPFVFLVVVLASFFVTEAVGGESYDIAEFYEEVSVPYGAAALTSMDEVVEIKSVMVPKNLDIGTYEVQVKRRGQDLYEVVGYGLIIKTRYCYMYGYSVNALLKCTSSAGFSKGQLIFID
jgi:hypothetical protein